MTTSDTELGVRKSITVYAEPQQAFDVPADRVSADPLFDLVFELCAGGAAKRCQARAIDGRVVVAKVHPAEASASFNHRGTG